MARTFAATLIVSVLFAGSASAQEQWEHPDARLAVEVHNNYYGPSGRDYETSLYVKLFSQNRRGKEWGPYSVAPFTNYTPEHILRIVIDCKRDEYICLGAWDPAGDFSVGFGDGEHGQSCNNCCLHCDGLGHKWEIGSNYSIIDRGIRR